MTAILYTFNCHFVHLNCHFVHHRSPKATAGAGFGGAKNRFKNKIKKIYIREGVDNSVFKVKKSKSKPLNPEPTTCTLARYGLRDRGIKTRLIGVV